MSKMINLIPPSVKHERNIKKAKNSIIYVSLACAGSFGGFYEYEKHLQQQIDSLKSEISKFTDEQNQISETLKTIQSTIDQKNSISSSAFPYHRFLYFLTVNAPDDLRILSVKSVSQGSNLIGSAADPTQTGQAGQPAAQGTQTATGTSAATPNTAPTGTGTQGAQTAPSPATNGQSNSNPASGGQATNATSGTQKPNSSSQTTTSQNGATGTPTTNTSQQNNSGTGATQKSSEQSSPFNLGTSEIYLRGYSIYPDSVSTLVTRLKNEDYIDSVKVDKVGNYYTGLQNFKLFEIKITYH